LGALCRTHGALQHRQWAGKEDLDSLGGCEGRWGESRLRGSWWLSNLETISPKSPGGAVTTRLPHLQIWFLLPHVKAVEMNFRQ